ncbi:MAG: TPM domain-containing protein [Verrucomicrobiales bacterium]|nr:TPM domain-containing protein [Verrucomicrobiales bacterium]
MAPSFPVTAILPSSAIAALVLGCVPLLAASPAAAQEVVTTDPLHSAAGEARDVIPAAPAGQLLDEAGLFQEAERGELEAKLRAFRDEGFAVYAATFTFIYGEDANQRAIRLADKWINGRNGAVLVYNKSAGENAAPLGIACAQEGARPFSTEMLLEVAHRAAAAANAATEPREKVRSGTLALVTELQKLRPLLTESRWMLSATQLKIAGMVLGAMGASLLLLLLARRFQKASEQRTGEVLLFPEIEVAQRYGAPFGGGVVVQMEFGSPIASGERA